MTIKQSSPKHFRIERLEERITPGMLFWADDLGVNALTQWAVIEASDSPQSLPKIVAGSATVLQATLIETPQRVSAELERVEFPAWAERILHEIEHELRTPAPQLRTHGVTDGVTFFSDVMNTPRSTATQDKSFPLWAQELLADLNQQPVNEKNSQIAIERNVCTNEDANVESDMFVPPKCEVGRFPDWAEQLLNAVERRISHDAQVEAAGNSAASPLQDLDEIVARRLPSARRLEASLC